MTTKSNGNAKIILYVIVAFAIYYATVKLYFHPIDRYIIEFIPNHIAAFVVSYLLVGLPLFIATWRINQQKNIFRDLGYAANPWIGLAFAAICTLPMFAGYAYMAGGVVGGVSITVLVGNNLLAGVFEETYFRGFLFGQLFRNTRLGFLPSILLCSVLFASGHLWESSDPKILLGILTVTFIGSVWYAWLYVEWGYNIYVPMFLHSLMDASWYIFSAGPNALGGGGANVFRLVTVVLTILLTIIYKRYTKQPFLINKQTMWRASTSAKSRVAAPIGASL